MKLSILRVSGYKSIAKTLELHLDRRNTVVLGANDHGKTNILNALLHLNEDSPFVEDDLNWDLEDDHESYPLAEYIFQLNEDERVELLEEWQASVTETEDAEGEVDSNEQVPDDQGADLVDGDDDSADEGAVSDDAKEDDAVPEQKPSIKLIPSQLLIRRQGVATGITWPETDISILDECLHKFLRANMPRVEMIKAIEAIQDSVAPDELITDANEFMQGIFYTAGLNPLDAGDLFEHNDRTSRRINDANTVLNRELRISWAQGRDSDLRFALEHRNSRIDMVIEDPAVESRFVRASRRGSGFTHFFAMSMVLHARRTKSPAASYIWLFDEPGVWLHPTGQRDLLQVLETLSRESQIVYATHSLFMINKNYPVRHRLITKDGGGTRIDGKPYVGRWRAALDYLGLALPGTILFAPHVLLTEGDTDPIFIHAMLQLLVLHDELDFDINLFSSLSTENSKHTAVLTELLTSSAAECKVANLVDGDEGGKTRLKSCKSFLESRNVQSKVLATGTSLEDHLPFLRSLYVQAVAVYIHKLGMDLGIFTADKKDDVKSKVSEDFEREFPGVGVEQGVSKWAMEVGQRLFSGFPAEPSKVGIAREYVDALSFDYIENTEAKVAKAELKRPRLLAAWIKEALEIPGILASPTILSE